MGRNFYLNSTFKFGIYTRTIYRECHVGRNNCLDIIDICRFYREILQIFDEDDVDTYINYLERVDDAVKAQSSDESSQLVFNPEFNNLPQMIVSIYKFILDRGYELVPEDEYDEPYDFEDHILNHCTKVHEDVNEVAFGGLQYSTSTGFF